MEREIGKIKFGYVLRYFRVPLVEFQYQLSATFDILCWSPLILLNPKSLPMYQILEIPSEHLAV